MNKPDYRKTLLLPVALLFGLSLSAQVGITTLYNFNDARQSVDNGTFQELSPIYENGPELALNYWFRLPKNRVEFLPTVYYTTAGDRVKWSEYGFQFKTNIYVFDLATDCDCPTFGKQGPQLDKGFFLQLSPGVARHGLRGTPADGQSTSFTLGAGMGIDFGVSNLLTITPLVSFRHHFGNFYESDFIDADNQPVEYRNRLTSYQVGLQATFRFDKKRY